MNQHLISGNTCSVTCSHTSRLYPQRFLWLFLWLQIEITCDFHHVPMPKPHFERRLINLVQGTGNTHEDIHIFGTALWHKAAAMPATHMGAGSSSSCPAFCYWPGKAMEDGQGVWAPDTHVAKRDEALGFRLAQYQLLQFSAGKRREPMVGRSLSTHLSLILPFK